MQHQDGCAAAHKRARQANMHLLQWLVVYHSDRPIILRVMDPAAEASQLEALEWLDCQTNSDGCSKSAIVAAVRGGRLAVATWLCEHNATNSELTVQDSVIALRCSHVDTAAFAFELVQQQQRPLEQFMRDLERVMAAAAECGHLEMVQWLYDRATALSTPFSIADARTAAVRSAQSPRPDHQVAGRARSDRV